MNFSLHTAQKRCAPLLFALLAALVLVVLWFCLGIAFEYTTTAPVTTGSYTMQDGETLTQVEHRLFRHTARACVLV